MSEDTAFQSVGTSVMSTLPEGVAVPRGETPGASSTLVMVVFPVARSYQLTLSSPRLSALRNAGMKCRPPTFSLSWTSADAAFKLPSEYDCIRMSPNGWYRASFHTMGTVPDAPETAILGKSLAGKRLEPGTKAPIIDVTLIAVVFVGPPDAKGSVRCANGTRLTTLRTGSFAHAEKPRLVAQLCSYATYTSPVAESTAGYAPSFSQKLGEVGSTTRYGGW